MPRILIVDDDRETCRFMAELLGRPGRERSQIGARPRRRDRARCAVSRSICVISDINLNAPQSGLDVLRAFKQREPGRAGAC